MSENKLKFLSYLSYFLLITGFLIYLIPIFFGKDFASFGNQWSFRMLTTGIICSFLSVIIPVKRLKTKKI